MKKIVTLVALALVALAASNAQAAPARWVPGNPYFISEDDATSFEERAFDYAYCRGIARYGKRGEFPDEEFLRFDCTIELDSGSTCHNVRLHSIKGSSPGKFRMSVPKAQPKMWCS